MGAPARLPAAERLMELLRPFDEAVAVQAASLCCERGLDLNGAVMRRAIDGAPPHVRHGFVARPTCGVCPTCSLEVEARIGRPPFHAPGFTRHASVGGADR